MQNIDLLRELSDEKILREMWEDSREEEFQEEPECDLEEIF